VDADGKSLDSIDEKYDDVELTPKAGLAGAAGTMTRRKRLLGTHSDEDTDLGI
jgi:hypothetical protein